MVLAHLVIGLLAGAAAPSTATPPADQAMPAAKELFLKTSDGWILSAHYRRAGGDSGPGPAVILLHRLGSGKSEWLPLEGALARRGVSVLAINMRGHAPREADQHWEFFLDLGPNGQWASMWKDAEAALRYLRSKGHKRIGVAGSSLGANVAINAASRLKGLGFAVLLSPGIEFQGVRTPEALAAYGPRPLLIAAARRDPYPFQSAGTLREQRLRAALPADWVETRSGHGVEMFRDPEALDRVADWIASHAR